MRPVWYFCFTLFFVGMVGCTTTMEKSLESVRLGMDKASVLDLVGNPKRTSRKGSVDRWTYIYFVDGRELTKEIQFSENRVVSIGEAERENQVLQDYETLVKEKEHGRKSK